MVQDCGTESREVEPGRNQIGAKEELENGIEWTLDNAPKPSHPGNREDAVAPFAVTQKGHSLRQVPGISVSSCRRWWDGIRGV